MRMRYRADEMTATDVARMKLTTIKTTKTIKTTTTVKRALSSTNILTQTSETSWAALLGREEAEAEILAKEEPRRISSTTVDSFAAGVEDLLRDAAAAVETLTKMRRKALDWR